MEDLCYRGCSSACLRDNSRLKQHLYQVHRQSEYIMAAAILFFKTSLSSMHTLNRDLLATISSHNSKENWTEDRQIPSRNARLAESFTPNGSTSTRSCFRIRVRHKHHLHMLTAIRTQLCRTSSITLKPKRQAYRCLCCALNSRTVLLSANIALASWTKRLSKHRRRFVALLRPRLDRLTLPKLQARLDTQPAGNVVHDTPLSGVAAGTQQLPALDDTLSVDSVSFDLNERFAALDGTVEGDYVNIHFESDPWFSFTEVD
jgi:hypothetical protein